MSKLSSEAFPYPVLTDQEDGDYYNSFFESEISIELKKNEITSANDLEINYEFLLDNKEIAELIEKEKADFAILVISKSTFYREIFYAGKKTKGSFSLELTDLYGNVEFQPQIVVIDDNVKFTSEDLNNEFKLENDAIPYFNLSIGDTIAFSENVYKNISFEPLTLESLIRVNKDVSLDENIYSIDPSSNQYLTINMGENYHKKWSDPISRKYLISSVIKDAILFSLKEYLDNKEDVEQKKWASLILEKFKDIEEDKNDLKNDLDKLNRVALQIAAKYTLNTITDFQEG